MKRSTDIRSFYRARPVPGIVANKLLNAYAAHCMNALCVDIVQRDVEDIVVHDEKLQFIRSIKEFSEYCRQESDVLAADVCSCWLETFAQSLNASRACFYRKLALHKLYCHCGQELLLNVKGFLRIMSFDQFDQSDFSLTEPEAAIEPHVGWAMLARGVHA